MKADGISALSQTQRSKRVAQAPKKRVSKMSLGSQSSVADNQHTVQTNGYTMGSTTY